MKASEKKQIIFGLIENLEDNGYMPLAQCIGLGECVLGNKARHAGSDITYWAKIAVDKLHEKGMPAEIYNQSIKTINSAK